MDFNSGGKFQHIISIMLIDFTLVSPFSWFSIVLTAPLLSTIRQPCTGRSPPTPFLRLPLVKRTGDMVKRIGDKETVMDNEGEKSNFPQTQQSVLWRLLPLLVLPRSEKRVT